MLNLPVKSSTLLTNRRLGSHGDITFEYWLSNLVFVRPVIGAHYQNPVKLEA